MPRYVLLMNYTDEGMRNIKFLPHHLTAFRQAVVSAGGRLPHIFLTMGPYDLVAIVEAASDETCVTIALALSSLGNVRSTTLKAFGETEIPSIADNIPSLEDEYSRILRGFGST